MASAAALTLFGIPALGILLHKLPDLLGASGGTGILTQISEIGIVLGLSAALAWTGILPLAVFGHWALTRGWAGWTSFAILGAIIGPSAVLWFGELPNGPQIVGFAISGLIYALVFRGILHLLLRRPAKVVN